jgi:hypothetical protein
MRGPRPSARANHGFAAAADGRLYVYGGQLASGILVDGDSISQGEAPLPTGLVAALQLRGAGSQWQHWQAIAIGNGADWILQAVPACLPLAALGPLQQAGLQKA